MEKFTKNHIAMFVFIFAGLLFSGYLAGTKFFSDTCAFGASCPIFLGYPACYTGFLVYAILTAIVVVALLKKELTRALLVTVTGVSFFGVLFSGKLTFGEMSVLFEQGFVAFIKSLPLCSIGLIVFAIVFILSLIIGNECKGPCCGKCKKTEDEVKTLEASGGISNINKEEIVENLIEPAFPQKEDNSVPALDLHVPVATEAAPEEPVEIKSDLT